MDRPKYFFRDEKETLQWSIRNNGHLRFLGDDLDTTQFALDVSKQSGMMIKFGLFGVDDTIIEAVKRDCKNKFSKFKGTILVSSTAWICVCREVRNSGEGKWTLANRSKDCYWKK